MSSGRRGVSGSLPWPEGDEVLQLAERIRAAIAEIAIPGISLHGSVTCTATIGVSNPFITSQAFDITLQQADAALYRGKSAGRNRVQRADPEYLLPQAQKARQEDQAFLTGKGPEDAQAAITVTA
jgi:hypothetical protein